MDEKVVKFQNNFDFLRILFATFVVITHSYPLAGYPEIDSLYRLTNGQVSFSNLGVHGFFVVSGFLIFLSLKNSVSLKQFYVKRILRIFPALIVVLFLSVFFIVPLMSNQSLITVFGNIWFFYHNSFSTNPIHAINGSLWTIIYEVFFYILLGFLFSWRKISGIWILLTVMLLALLFLRFTLYFEYEKLKSVFLYTNMQIHLLIDLGLYFLAGSLLASSGIHLKPRKPVTLLCIACFILIIFSLHYQVYVYLKYLIYPLFVITFAYLPISFFTRTLDRTGDISYGVYIYAFPVQQMLVYFFHPPVFQLAIGATIISYFLGFLSWHLVEKHALSLKKKVIY